jgi:hypothetical protein
MQKSFCIINPDTNIVEQIVVVDETQVGLLYPYRLIIAMSDDINQPRYYPGCLYHNDKFWAPFTVVSPSDVSLSHYQFRELFTYEEMVRVDNFNTDSNLSLENKKVLYSFVKTLESTMSISLSNQYLIDGLNFLVSIGYITESRRLQIMNMEKPV